MPKKTNRKTYELILNRHDAEFASVLVLIVILMSMVPGDIGTRHPVFGPTPTMLRPPPQATVEAQVKATAAPVMNYDMLVGELLNLKCTDGSVLILQQSDGTNGIAYCVASNP